MAVAVPRHRAQAAIRRWYQAKPGVESVQPWTKPELQEPCPGVKAPPTTSYWLAVAVPDPAHALTCEQAVMLHDVGALLGAFRAARLRGHRAEGCLTREALSNYIVNEPAGSQACGFGGSPEPIVLYGCGAHRVISIPDASIQAERADLTRIQLAVNLSGLNTYGNPIELGDHLVIGAGIPVGAQTAAAQVITDADSY